LRTPLFRSSEKTFMRPKCYDPSRPDIYMMSVYLARRSSGGMGCASGARDMRTPACGLFLSLVLEILLDSARLSVGLTWLARVSALASAAALSAALFGLAFSVAFGPLLYLGICLMLLALLTTSIGLLRATRAVVR